MPRNAEVIRQWTILREIENARAGGVTIDDLAAIGEVTTRTIRRDLEALQAAGFPLYDEKADDGKTRWRVNGPAFKGLTAGLTMAELCALYFSRTLLESLSGTPFRSDVERAFEKLSSALTPHMRQFLDQLPRAIATKADPLRRHDDPRLQPIVSRALDATVEHRQANLTYYSKSSDRTKSYLVHPYRLAYAQGGMYLLAYVPEYDEMRTFAVERIQSIALLDERFTPTEELPETAFPHSLGVHSGPPEPIEIEFAPAVADYVRGREWHPSQQVRDLEGGGITINLNVCRDHALQSWILGFGPLARVLAPETLVREIAKQLSEATARYPS